MDCFIPELLIPENIARVLWSCCRNCREMRTCPHIIDQALRYTSGRGQETAHILEAEAERYMEAVSVNSEIQGLLNSSGALVRALTQALYSERIQTDDLSAMTEKHGIRNDYDPDGD